MSEIIESFPSLDLNGTRRSVEEHWAEQVADAPDGWSVVPADPAGVAAAFGLEVRPGLGLVAVTYRWDRDGEGFVVALPRKEAEDLRRDGLSDLADDDELGAEAFASATPIGEALDGDGSPLSHLMASIATRELLALGQRGHGVGWPDELLVQDGEDEPVLPPGDPPPPPWTEWTQLGHATASWPPVVIRDGDAVEVRFHTVGGRGGWRVLRWVDRYEDDASYVFATESTEVAEAPGGWLT